MQFVDFHFWIGKCQTPASAAAAYGSGSDRGQSTRRRRRVDSPPLLPLAAAAAGPQAEAHDTTKFQTQCAFCASAITAQGRHVAAEPRRRID